MPTTLQDPPYRQAGYWRALAAQARTEAASMADCPTKQSLLRVAGSYEDLARIAASLEEERGT